ncbi:MAG TPA: hypothetical protein VHC72_08885, partial [Bryobacteraceae bacterium]|nr:hypothetical protein [Bryobacteraceae bacterium]
MTNIFQSWIVVGALAVSPVWGQLGAVGGVTSSVGGTVGSTVGATTRGAAGESAGVAGAPGGAAGRQNVFASLNATQNAALSSQLTPLLPASSSVPAGAAGFRDDMEFITAAHAAHNLNIPFEQLKAEMTGKKSMPLEAAVRKLRPELDSKAAKNGVSLARKQSERDIARASAAGSKDKVASRVTSDSRLAARVSPMVPRGQSLGDAAAGFKNEDQFLSTLHAANDNGIAFEELKDRVTAGQSLETAMHELKPSMDADASASAAAR